MSILSILEFPDPRLRTVAKPVVNVDKAIESLVDDMLETMYEAHGVGLAATQVDIHKRIIVIDTSEDKNNPLCLINPEIIKQMGEEESDEGCLSVPGVFEPVTRAEGITVTAQDQQGRTFELEAGGLLAVCIQHEMDHLQGKLFVDYLSSLKRQRIKKKMTKLHKREK
ncbi:peptide deformylase [Methylococcaceae bacterium HT1]|nr:peptide deformylase [Methylococcaceae bacterium HT1]TXL16598.1 peptide deformylase [Methylococcaceae bacterium HT3]